MRFLIEDNTTLKLNALTSRSVLGMRAIEDNTTLKPQIKSGFFPNKITFYSIEHKSWSITINSSFSDFS